MLEVCSRRSTAETSITTQRLARHVSAATDTKLIPGTERVSVSTNNQQTVSMVTGDSISDRVEN
jgi:hypothetical protein